MSNNENKSGDIGMNEVAFALKAMQQQMEKWGREMTNIRGELEEVRHSQQAGGTPNRRRGVRKKNLLMITLGRI